jgi:hypothetical protein
MKLENSLRLQAILIGFGAALLLANSAPAQEIENTQFDDGPIVAEFAQPSPAPAPKDISPAVTTATLVVAEQAAVPLGSSVEVWSTATVLFFIALVVLYALAEAKRANRNLAARTPSQSDSRGALS